MSCWVAPAIAAELWGMSLREIQDLVRRGTLATQTDGGFSFVRLPQYALFGIPRPPAERPSTFSVVTPDELSALHQKPPTTNGHSHGGMDSGDDNTGNDSEMGPPPDEDPSDNRITDWRAGRQSAARRRKPPGTFHA